MMTASTSKGGSRRSRDKLINVVDPNHKPGFR